MADWTKTQEDQITALYGQLKGEYKRKADKELFGGPQLPYGTAQSRLLNLINEQEKHEHGSLEAKTNAAHAETTKKSSGLFGFGQLTQPKAALGLVAIVLMLGMMTGPIGAAAGYKAATAYAAMPVY